MAALFNDSNVDELDSYEWFIADTSHEKFGETINEQLLDDGTTLGDSGIVILGTSGSLCATCSKECREQDARAT